MKNWKTHLIIAAVVLAACWIFSSVLAEPLMAQVRAALVKDVDNPSRQPFTATTNTVDFGVGVTTMNGALLTVPAGKRAIIEHLSCVNYLDQANNWIRFEMFYTSGGAIARHEFVHTVVGQSFVAGTNIWSLSQPVRAYADPSTSVSIRALRRTSTGFAGFECYVSGHYVDTTL